MRRAILAAVCFLSRVALCSESESDVDSSDFDGISSRRVLAEEGLHFERVLLSPKAAIWEEALETCRQVGLELPHIDSEEQERQLLALAEGMSGDGDDAPNMWWIGIQPYEDNRSRGFYRWSDGETLTTSRYAHFADGADRYPNGTEGVCFVLKKTANSSEWTAMQCAEPMPFVCYGQAARSSWASGNPNAENTTAIIATAFSFIACAGGYMAFVFFSIYRCIRKDDERLRMQLALALAQSGQHQLQQQQPVPVAPAAAAAAANFAQGDGDRDAVARFVQNPNNDGGHQPGGVVGGHQPGGAAGGHQPGGADGGHQPGGADGGHGHARGQREVGVVVVGDQRPDEQAPLVAPGVERRHEACADRNAGRADNAGSGMLSRFGSALVSPILGVHSFVSSRLRTSRQKRDADRRRRREQAFREREWKRREAIGGNRDVGDVAVGDEPNENHRVNIQENIVEPGFDMRDQHVPAADKTAPRSLHSRFFGHKKKKRKNHASHSYVRVDDASASEHGELEGRHGDGEGGGQQDVELVPLKPPVYSEDDDEANSGCGGDDGNDGGSGGDDDDVRYSCKCWRSFKTLDRLLEHHEVCSHVAEDNENKYDQDDDDDDDGQDDEFGFQSERELGEITDESDLSEADFSEEDIGQSGAKEIVPIRVEGRVPIYKCHECGREIRNKSNFKAHLREKHSKDYIKKHKCSVCGKTFARRSNMATHQKTHLAKKDRPHRCAKCGLSFAQRSNYTRHIDHHHDRPYPCPHKQCRQRFSTEVGVKSHFGEQHPGEEMKRVRGPQKMMKRGAYGCACRKNFTTLTELLEHQQVCLRAPGGGGVGSNGGGGGKAGGGNAEKKPSSRSGRVAAAAEREPTPDKNVLNAKRPHRVSKANSASRTHGNNVPRKKQRECGKFPPRAKPSNVDVQPRPMIVVDPLPAVNPLASRQEALPAAKPPLLRREEPLPANGPSSPRQQEPLPATGLSSHWRKETLSAEPPSCFSVRQENYQEQFHSELDQEGSGEPLSALISCGVDTAPEGILDDHSHVHSVTFGDDPSVVLDENSRMGILPLVEDQDISSGGSLAARVSSNMESDFWGEVSGSSNQYSMQGVTAASILHANLEKEFADMTIGQGGESADSTSSARLLVTDATQPSSDAVGMLEPPLIGNLSRNVSDDVEEDTASALFADAAGTSSILSDLKAGEIHTPSHNADLTSYSPSSPNSSVSLSEVSPIQGSLTPSLSPTVKPSTESIVPDTGVMLTEPDTSVGQTTVSNMNTQFIERPPSTGQTLANVTSISLEHLSVGSVISDPPSDVDDLTSALLADAAGNSSIISELNIGGNALREHSSRSASVLFENDDADNPQNVDEDSTDCFDVGLFDLAEPPLSSGHRVDASPLTDSANSSDSGGSLF